MTDLEGGGGGVGWGKGKWQFEERVSEGFGVEGSILGVKVQL